MSLKLLHFVIFILTSELTSSLPVEPENIQCRAEDGCKGCAPGSYMSLDYFCLKCPENTFTKMINKEDSCHHCFRDCRKELHMQVVSPCSKVSDVVCTCMEGYVCNMRDSTTGHCISCQSQLSVQTASKPHAQTLPHTFAPTTSYASEQIIKDDPTLIPQEAKKSQGNILQLYLLILTLCGLFIIFTFCFCKRRKIDCLKKRLKQCSVQKQKEDCKAIASNINKPVKQQHHAQMTHAETQRTTITDFPSPQSDLREQPLPTSGNLGPLHIYGASTVFVSLLNQFGQNAKDKDEEDLREQHLNSSEIHGPPSPTIPLSKEERNMDISYISSPFQEQGKECHLSKEEGL